MGTISLQIPVSGQPNSTEDPKIASDFTTIQTVINGNIDTNNVSPTAGITATQLAASAGITATQLSPSAGITATQLSPSAGITATQLSPTAGITFTQLATGSWVPLTLSSNIGNGAAGYVPSSRVWGDMVRLKGICTNNTGGTIAQGVTFATVAASAFPAQTVIVTGSVGTIGGSFNSIVSLQITTAGLVSALLAAGIGTGLSVAFDSITYSLS